MPLKSETPTRHIIYTLPPRLDTLTSTAVNTALDERIVDFGQPLVLDASELAYISSKGVRTLRRLRKKLLASGGALTILDPPCFAREVLIYGGLGDALQPADGSPTPGWMRASAGASSRAAICL